MKFVSYYSESGRGIQGLDLYRYSIKDNWVPFLFGTSVRATVRALVDGNEVKGLSIRRCNKEC